MPASDAYVYRPQPSSAPVYEQLLQALKRAATSTEIEGALEEVATDVIAIGRRPGVDVSDRKRALDRLLGSAATVGDDTARDVFALCAELEDFILEDNDGAGTNRGGIAAEADEDADDFDLSEADDDEAMRRVLDRYGGDEDDDVGDAPGGAADEELERPPTIADIDEAYLERNLRRLLPALSAQELTERAGSVLAELTNEEEPDHVVATQLTFVLDGFSDPAIEAWINATVAGRWAVVYGMKRATGAATQDELVAALRDHAGRDAAVMPVLASMTGSATAATVAAGANNNNNAAAGATAAGGSRRPCDMREVDLDGYRFEVGSKLAAKKTRTLVPKGTERRVHQSHEEIIVPPQPIFSGDVTLVQLSEFADWARPTFPSYVKTLKPMQSIVFPAAYHTDENLLISAPTGAGKTNVAMTTILRTLSAFRDEENDAFHYDLFKIVYIAPMKALVQEVVRTFGERLAPLGIRVAELSGDQTLSKAELADTQLIVTTPEKWDVVTRKGTDRGAAASVRLLIIDEIHLLHSERGPVLESVVARTRRASASGVVPPVRLVGLSATLPNYEDVADFLGVDRKRGLFAFNSAFRQVPLRQTFCGIAKSRAVKSISALNDVATGYALDFARKNQPVLVFVHGRKDTISTAEYVLRAAQKDGSMSGRQSTIMERLAAAAERAQHKKLRELVPFGVGFHNAGLPRDDRALVEELFLNGDLLVLVSTSTLAWGVNLPAHGVVIKGTKVFSPQAGGYEDLSALDVFQMFGRAGRPGFEHAAKYGEAVIITQKEDLEYYLSLLNQQLPIESQMMSRLVDCLNAEVVLGTVQSVEDAVQWIENTYLHVRMMRAPKLYGIPLEDARRDPTLKEHRENVAHTVLAKLAERGLAVYDRRWGDVRATDLGRIASHYYLSEDSVATYVKLLKPDVDDIDIFRCFSLSSEFARISVRADEVAEIRRLAAACPVPIRDPIMMPTAAGSGPSAGAAKINVLLQAFISRVSLDGFNLMSEMVYVKDSALRIAKAMHEIAVSRGLAATAHRLLTFYNQIHRQQWAVASPLRQFPPSLVPPRYVARMEARQVDWDAYYFFVVEDGDLSDLAPDDLDAQNMLYEYIHRVPRFDIDFDNVSLQPLTRTKVRCELTVMPDFIYDPQVHGPALELLVTIEDGDGRRLLHSETVYVRGEALQAESPAPIVITAMLRVADPKPTHWFARTSVVGWLGSDVSAPLEVISLPLPDPVPPPTEPVDREQSLEALDDAWLDSFFLGEVEKFNALQTTVFHPLYTADGSAFVGMPQGSGRTVATELFVLHHLRAALEVSDGGGEDNSDPAPPVPDVPATIVYLHPDPNVVQRRAASWRHKLSQLSTFVPEAAKDEASLVELLDPGVTSCVEENLRAIRLGTRKGVTRCRLLVASVAAWREIAVRPKEHADVLGSLAAIVADGVQWCGEVAVDPAETGSVAAGAGLAYDALLARILKDNKRKAKAAASSSSTAAAPKPAAILLASTPLQHAARMAKWAKVSTERVFNFSLSQRALKVEVEPSAAGPTPSAQASAALDRCLALLETRTYHVARVGVVMPTSKRVADTASLVSKLLRETPLKPFPGVTDPRLARVLSTGVAFVDAATAPADREIVLKRLMDPASTPPGLAPPTADGAPQELTVFLTPDVASRFPPGAFDHVLVVCPEHSPQAPRHPAPLCVGTRAERDYPVPLLQSIVTRGQLSATVVCSPTRAPFWATAMHDIPPCLPGVQQRLEPHIAAELAQAGGNGDGGDDAAADEKVTPQLALVNTIARQLLQEGLTWVASGAVRTLEALFGAVGELYVARAIRASPAAYFVGSGRESLSEDEFLSALVETIVTQLQGARALLPAPADENGEQPLRPHPLGLIADRHGLHPGAISPLISLQQEAGLGDVLRAIAATPGVSQLAPLRAGDEERALAKLQGTLSTSSQQFTGAELEGPCHDDAHKALLIITALGARARGFGSPTTDAGVPTDTAAAGGGEEDAVAETVRERLPPHMRALLRDARHATCAAFRAAVAAVDVFTRLRQWRLARAAMLLAQLLTQASVDTASPLSQLPHFSAARVAHAVGVEPSFTAPEQLSDLDEAVQQQVLAGLSDDAIADVASWCNALPVVDVSVVEPTRLTADGAAIQVAVRLQLLYADDDDDEENDGNKQQQESAAKPPPLAATPYWLRKERLSRWWVALVAKPTTAAASDVPRSVRLVVPATATQVVQLRVPLDPAEQQKAKAGGDDVVAAVMQGLEVSVISDTYRLEVKASSSSEGGSAS